MQKVIKIRNLDCAACAAELSEELAAIEGVSFASADFINQRVTLAYENAEALSRAIDTISRFEEVEIVDQNAPPKRERHLKEILSIAVSALFFLPALVLELIGGYRWYAFGLFLASFAAAGWSVAVAAAKNVVRAFRGGFHPLVLLDENLLMLIAAAGALALQESMEGAAVMLLYQIGELLQSIAVGSSRSAITRLMALKSDAAIRITGTEQEEVDPEELSAGDVVLLRRGDRAPADLSLLEGETSLDTKSLTGESYLKEVRAGDEILAGCVNEGNAVKARVVRPASESAVAKILELVENASSKKAKPEKFITRFARIYTPVVVLLAVLLAVVPPLCGSYDFPLWIGRALNFLIISCPCALVISVPLTYFSGVGALARCGVLSKGAVGLDLLARVRVAAFDKTGTLTEGKFSIVDVNGGDHVLTIAASAEKISSHPLSRTFDKIEAPMPESSSEIAGMGISAVVCGRSVLVGSKRLMETHGIAAPDPGEKLVVFVAEEGALIGWVEIADRVRSEAAEALAELKREGVGTIAVLTGDGEVRAREALKGLPLDVLEAGLMPEEKPVRAEKLKKDGALLYVGDGINDTPVMAAADVAVAMGGLSSDAAIEASDFVLADESLTALPKAIRGSKKTRRIVFENIIGSILIKVALMVLSVFGLILPWVAVAGDVGVMLLAVLNSMRMRRKLK